MAVPTTRPIYSMYLATAVVAMIAVHIGFATTFIIPIADGTFVAPAAIYIHGAFAFSWILLFLVQATLVNRKKIKLHQRLGILAVVIALGTAVTMISAGLAAVEKELTAGLGDTAISGLLGTCTSAIMFLALVICGMYFRNKKDRHKRFLFLATVVVLWPAWFRFRHYFPDVPRPDIWFGLVLADSLIVIAWIWERYTIGKVHPVLLWGGVFIIIDNIFEVTVFDSPGWRIVARVVYDGLT
jgi:hypothetical protein